MTVQVIRRDLAGWIDPSAVFRVLADRDRDLIWLDAGPNADSGFSYVALDTRDAVDAADFGREAASRALNSVTAPGAPEGRFSLGLVGWFGYEVGARSQGAPVADTGIGTRLAMVVSMLEFDHATQRMTHVSLSDASYVEGAEAICALAQSLDARQLDSESDASEQTGVSRTVRWRHTDRDYAQLIGVAQRHIHAGDAFQLCLTNTAEVTPRTSPAEAVAAYLALRQRNPSHHGGFVRLGDTTLLSSSPEVFLSVSPDGLATTKPIKGTRPRGDSAAIDAQLRRDLAENRKEQAENVMIVDLMRNDLARVSTPGSVTVDALLDVESYANVHQLVSTVRGQLAPHINALDALEACFPAGSMTGAPKISAMTILNRLEGGPRGLYSGAFGYLGFDGALELAMVIRSIVVTPEGVFVGSGGGITSDSVPDDEVAEMHLKVAPLLEVLGVDGRR